MFLAMPPDNARHTLKTMRFSNADAEWIAGLAGGWQSVGPDMERALLSGAEVPDGLIRLWVAAAGRTRVASLLRIASARWSAQRAAGSSAPSAASVRALYRRAIRSAFRDAVDLADLAVDGDDLIGAGFAPGKQLGEILRELLVVVLADPSQNTRAQLLAVALQKRGGHAGAGPA
jgi:hypothetical protein